jgi:chaperonin GroEL
MNTQVFRTEDIKEKIKRAVDTIADPVRYTLSPKGRDVIIEDSRGNISSTNDGVTIAKAINAKDPVENIIIQAIKYSSLKTNTEVGDGTSTSIVLSQVLIKEGLKLIENGMNEMDVRRALEKAGEQILEKLKKKAIKIKSDKDLQNIARISANSDDVIAKNVLKAVKVVGTDGMIFLEENNKPETEVEESIGFNVEAGLFSAELRNNPQAFSAQYKDVPVLITDKRLYYSEEAETILRTVMMAGHKEVVIVARDFIGQFVPTIVANHAEGACKVLLVKDPNATDKNSETLEDLAVYLGGRVVSEKTGSLVDNLEFSDFVIAKRAFADGTKTIIEAAKKRSKAVDDRVKALQSELAKDKEDSLLKKRIASMTSGMVTIRVGGATKLDLIERIYRYEDAVHATRAALKDGYLVGGGVTLMSLADEILHDSSEVKNAIDKMCTANVRQIAENCGEHPESVLVTVKNFNKNNKLKDWRYGYNALTGNVEDLLKAGVVDPYKVTEMAVRNSIAVASRIISSGFIIAHIEEDKKE